MSLNSVLKIYFFVFSMILSSVAEAEKAAVPESKRIYVVEKKSSKPVIITSEAGGLNKGQVILRDPSLKSSGRPAPKIIQKKVVASAKRPVKRNGKMTFRPVKIDGNLKRPRVEFQEEYLKVGISEESYGADFFQKINDPLKDSEF